MNEAALVTVIVPTYNSPDIFQTILSVLEQDYPRMQLILIDDGSKCFPKVDIEQFIEEHRQSGLEQYLILVNSENCGTVCTMNRAICHSRGDYVFNLAGDDCFYDEKVISDWVAEFQRTKAHIITCRRAVYDERLETCFCTEPLDKQIALIRSKTPEQLFEILAKANFILGCCTARTAESIRKYGLFDERYRLIEDHSMYLKLLRQGEPILFFDRIVVKYRGGGTSSPEQYNDVYARDVDAILRYEVLPYTKHPIAMRIFFFRWKRLHQFYRKYNWLYARYSTNRAARILLHIWFYLHHPDEIAGRIRKHIKDRQ